MKSKGVDIEININPKITSRVSVQMYLTFTFREQSDADRIYDSENHTLAFPVVCYGEAIERAAIQFENDFEALLEVERVKNSGKIE